MIVKSVIVAAGKGKRFGAKKQFEKVKERLVIEYSYNVLKEFGEVVIVCSSEDMEFVKGVFKDSLIVEGGKERMNSVYNGLMAIDECDIVLVHDAARPVITKEMVQRVIKAVERHQAAIPAIPAYETLKISEAGFTKNTIDRSKIVVSQTPQGFIFDKLIKAVFVSISNGEIYTDEATAWEKTYGGVKVVEGSRKNIKITTKEDLEIVRCLLG